MYGQNNNRNGGNPIGEEVPLDMNGILEQEKQKQMEEIQKVYYRVKDVHQRYIEELEFEKSQKNLNKNNERKEPLIAEEKNDEKTKNKNETNNGENSEGKKCFGLECSIECIRQKKLLVILVSILIILVIVAIIVGCTR